jgi:hypothetical protein
MLELIKYKILDYVFIISNQPVLLQDLLITNDLHIENMRVNNAQLGFRLDVVRSYIIFISIVTLIILPLLYIGHMFLVNMDPHTSILASIIFTAFVFISFNIFREKLIDMMTIKRIKDAWKNHFPYFEYYDYHKKVALLYAKSKKDQISKQELQVYILDSLTKNDN